MSKKMKPIRLLVVALTLVVIGAILFSTMPDNISARLNGTSSEIGNVQHFSNQ
ncbi:MAG: hypothetical protein Q8P68_00400 [Candidatus Peregrinibacteria bacterium]|nr:hypothetical protein [Candidatus Peregrinibacteria bacterium]